MFVYTESPIDDHSITKGISKTPTCNAHTQRFY